MTETYIAHFVVGPLLGWLVAVAVGIVGYLATLQYKEMQRHRRMEAERARLGLKRA